MSKYQRAILVLLLALLNIYLFWPGRLYFLNDDFIHIPLTAQNQLFQTNAVRPLHELLVKLDLLLWNKNAAGFHLTALVLHCIVTVQLYDLCSIMQQRWASVAKPTAEKGAFLAVVLFLLYPQHAESIAWILGRTPVLSCVFLLLALRSFFNTRLSLANAVFAAFAFAAALFTYEQSIFVPVLLIAVAFYEKNEVQRKQQMRVGIALGIAAVVYIVCRKIITAELVGNYEGGNLVHLQPRTLALNFCRLVVRLMINPATEPKLFVASLGMVAILVMAILFFGRKTWRSKQLFFCAAMIFLLILPVISLGISIHSFESGRYMYLPSVFLVMALSMITIPAVAYSKKAWIPVMLLCAYWLGGKWQASVDYTAASAYAQKTMNTIVTHFSHSSDTLRIDTVKQEIHGLPVFRMGLNEGSNWINHSVDTNKIVIYQHP